MMDKRHADELLAAEFRILLEEQESNDRELLLSYIASVLEGRPPKTTIEVAMSPGQRLTWHRTIERLRNALTHLEKSDQTDDPLNARPPFNAEYVLYLLLRRDERNAVVGDLRECHRQICQRFNKRRADIWFYKQVFGSLWPLFKRAVIKIGALIWLGRMLRRLIS